MCYIRIMSGTGNITPFSGKRLHENEERAFEQGLEETCCVCGRGIKNNKGFWAEVKNGGAAFVAEGETVEKNHPGYMGCYTVGPACARKLKKQGAALRKMG